MYILYLILHHDKMELRKRFTLNADDAVIKCDAKQKLSYLYYDVTSKNVPKDHNVVNAVFSSAMCFTSVFQQLKQRYRGISGKPLLSYTSHVQI